MPPGAPGPVLPVGSQLGDITGWTTGDIIARRASLHGERRFLEFVPDGRCFSYRDLHRITSGLAIGLRGLGVGRGDHVAVLMDNCPEQVFAMFAAGKLGAVAVPINTAARGLLLKYYLELADVGTIVLQADYVERLLPLLAELPLLRRMVVLGDVDAARRALQGTRVEVHGFPGAETASDEEVDASVRFSDLLYLMFTSGTTGPSKAIMMTHASAHAWAAQTVAYRDYREGDVEYVCMPLFHVNALLISTTSALMAGTSVALSDRFSASRFWDEIRASGATRFNSIGAIGNFLWSRPPSPDDTAHRVRVCTLAPTPVFGPDFERRFGLRIMGGYSLSDYCAATALTVDAPVEKMFSVGKPRAGVQVRVVDENDMDVPQGTPGEIVLRSEHMWAAAPGYYKMPEATLASRRNLWFHTGDRGYFDAGGYLYFTDRIKDAIRRRGENISAYEVESVIVTHPAVGQVAVYPLKSGHTEDEVAASGVLHPGQRLSPGELVAYCAENMAHYMVPRYLEFVEELPCTPSQKVEKYKLRQRAEADVSRMWDRLAGERVQGAAS